MDLATFLITIIVLVLLYPFTVYFKLKSLSKDLSYHWNNIENLIQKYETTKAEETLQNINRERRAYNALVRANDHKLDSTFGKFIANKYSFEKRKHFDFKA